MSLNGYRSPFHRPFFSACFSPSGPEIGCRNANVKAGFSDGEIIKIDEWLLPSPAILPGTGDADKLPVLYPGPVLRDHLAAGGALH